ncbi:MAG: hypothetical protein HZA46_07090, partial [Planctomycetales bacterium]|nr:hypothetical protein [Planctomycetales bacterium]
MSATEPSQSAYASDLESTLIVEDRDDISRAPIEFVEGSGPQLVTETQLLLHSRLRAAALVLFLAVGAFYVRGFFTSVAVVREIHLLATIGLGGLLAWLLKSRTLPLASLRRYEMHLFGGVVLFLGLT